MARGIEIIEEINDGILFLRKVVKNDAPFFFASLNEENLTTYLSLGPLKSIDDSKKLVKNYLKYWEGFAQYNFIIELGEDNKSKIGSISLWNVNWRHYRAEIGVWIIPTYWNKGYGKKSLELIKIIGFNHLKLNRLEAHIAVDNLNSIHLFKNCKFSEEGILKEYLSLNGVYYDALVLALLRHDF